MIIDSSALIAILTRESDADTYIRILAGATTAISPATCLECAIVVRSKIAAGLLDSAAERALDDLFSDLQAEVIPVDEHQMHLAIGAFRQYGRGSGSPARLNFGDCFSYALAKSLNEPLLFKGNDFIHTDVIDACA